MTQPKSDWEEKKAKDIVALLQNGFTNEVGLIPLIKVALQQAEELGYKDGLLRGAEILKKANQDAPTDDAEDWNVFGIRGEVEALEEAITKEAEGV